jgi:hypothetical protein
MMSFLTYITGFFMNFELLPILTDYMLKSSSLCLYSSNLGTFWLKIEQFWPFEEISIFSLVAILVGSRDHRTQFWKGAIQRLFGNSHKNLLV